MRNVGEKVILWFIRAAHLRVGCRDFIQPITLAIVRGFIFIDLTVLLRLVLRLRLLLWLLLR